MTLYGSTRRFGNWSGMSHSRLVVALAMGLPCVVVFTLASTAVMARPATAQGASGCPDVRPGAHVQTSKGTGGTLNFLFRGSDGHHYVGTAGHLLADEETHVWRKNGPSATIDDGTVIGRAVFAWNYNSEDADFALIKLARGVKFDPAMCHWGGPTGVNKDISHRPTVLRHYGAGMGISAVAPERTMVAPTLAHKSKVGALGVVAFGDSGSPVISEDGRALGIQFLLGAVVGSPPDGLTPGNVGIYRLTPQVAGAEKALGITLKLMEAPLA